MHASLQTRVLAYAGEIQFGDTIPCHWQAEAGADIWAGKLLFWYPAFIVNNFHELPFEVAFKKWI